MSPASALAHTENQFYFCSILYTIHICMYVHIFGYFSRLCCHFFLLLRDLQFGGVFSLVFFFWGIILFKAILAGGMTTIWRWIIIWERNFTYTYCAFERIRIFFFNTQIGYVCIKKNWQIDTDLMSNFYICSQRNIFVWWLFKGI